ncbi:MAG: 1-phosphofructokinase family hexose kinase [bacterium]
MIHLVSLNPALDFFFTLEKSKTGKVGTLQKSSAQAGGKALNVARFLRSMRVPAVTWLGTGGGSDPTHIFFQSLLNQERLKVRYLSALAPIRFTAVLSKEKKYEKYNHPGFGSDLPFFGKLLESVKRGDRLILTGRLPAGMSEALYASWIKLFQNRAVQVGLDVSGLPLAKALAQRPWFFKVNLFELRDALQMQARGLKELSKLIPQLIRRGLLHGAVTHGAEGALVWNGPESYWVRSSRKVKGMVVGAGDGFLAGYLKGLQSRKSFKESIRLACATGTTVAQTGIMGFNLKTLSGNLKTVKIVSL